MLRLHQSNVGVDIVKADSDNIAKIVILAETPNHEDVLDAARDSDLP